MANRTQGSGLRTENGVAFKIGLTGNIGCGKSAVGALLQELGAEYVDADQLVHQQLAPGGPAVAQVAERFGAQLRTADRGIDRRALAAIVFSDPAALRELEAIVVPPVRAQ